MNWGYAPCPGAYPEEFSRRGTPRLLLQLGPGGRFPGIQLLPGSPGGVGQLRLPQRGMTWVLEGLRTVEFGFVFGKQAAEFPLNNGVNIVAADIPPVR